MPNPPITKIDFSTGQAVVYADTVKFTFPIKGVTTTSPPDPTPPPPVPPKTDSVINALVNGQPASGTLAALVALTPAGGTLDLAAGTFLSTAIVSKPMTIRGKGKGLTILSGIGMRPTWDKACILAQVSGVTVAEMTIEDWAIAGSLGGNAAAVRAEPGMGMTVINVEARRNQDGVLSGGGAWTLAGVDFHDNGAGNPGSGATHEQYFSSDSSGVVKETDVTSKCGPLATHALKSRSATTLLTRGVYTGNSTDPTGGGNAGALVDLPECGLFTATGSTFVMPRGSANTTWLNYGGDNTNNAAVGMKVSLLNCIFKDGTGSGGTIRSFRANAALDVTGSTYTGLVAPKFEGWGQVTGTMIKV